MNKKIIVNVASRPRAYAIEIGSSVLRDCGSWAQECLGSSTRRIVVVSNKKVHGLYGRQTVASLAASGFKVSTWLIGDGERYKTLASAEKLLAFLAANDIQRTDALVALGGGVVGDLAGFAAAVYLRGISFLQIPTTLLAMIDSSVGGKTGVNSTFGKNQIGAFHQPNGVLIDIATLATLRDRELTAGFSEAIKQGAVAGKELFSRTADLLQTFAPRGLSRCISDKKFEKHLYKLIAGQIEFKAGIVTGDERESSKRTDARSRKVLNFGHTLAHALEKASDYKHLRHGEAVGYGILFAAELSKSLALCGENDVKLLNDVVHRAGPLPRLTNIDERKVLESFRSDKKHISGSLQMVLLKGIGKPVIIDENEISKPILKTALKACLKKWS